MNDAGNSSEIKYLEMLKKIMEEGVLCHNRTGIDTLAIPHVLFQHDMSQGFPLFTTKKMHFNSVKVELEFFIKGMHVDIRALGHRNIVSIYRSPLTIYSDLGS